MNDDVCSCGRLRRATRTISRAYDEALAPHRLTVTQFSILRTLDQLGEQTLNQLAEVWGYEKSGLWRTLQPLIRDGLLETGVGTARNQTTRISDAGRERLQAALPDWSAVQNRLDDGRKHRNDRLLSLLEELEALA